MEQNTQPSPYHITNIQKSLFSQVYAWMTIALCITGVFSFLTLSNSTFLNFLSSHTFFYLGLILCELGLVIYLSRRIFQMNEDTAKLAFFGYSALNGITLSLVFLNYTNASLVSTFFITAGMFGIMSFFGATTRFNLSGLGQFFMMALIGFLLASIVNIFLGSSLLYWITTYIGIILFAGLTAYDTQKIKELAAENPGKNIVIYAALTLYLDFINLFLLLLRVFGISRD